MSTCKRLSTAQHIPQASVDETDTATGPGTISDHDLIMIAYAAEVAVRSAGMTMPHPNHGCVLVAPGGEVVAETFLYAQGTMSCEVQAAEQAGKAAAGGCAYLNMECGDCHGDSAAVRALVAAGIKRVVMGMRHPAPHHRGEAVGALLEAGLQVDVLGEAAPACPPEAVEATIMKCLMINEPLIHRITMRRPLSVFKYAMTIDGKIATTTGHSAWVSGPNSRGIVHATRAQCDAIIVGGRTVSRDNCRLTTRREEGHTPTRIVMSRNMDLPEEAHLWDVSVAPTIVFTQTGARPEMQEELKRRGVEVVEMEPLTPAAVADFCYSRGFLQLMWECGGALAAPAIADGVVHKVMAFIAPKMIGGAGAPTPVGDLSLQEMTGALELVQVDTTLSGSDILLTGYLKKTSGGLLQQAKMLEDIYRAARGGGAAAVASLQLSRLLPTEERGSFWRMSARPDGTDITFYKAWDVNGALTNFSPHPICMPPVAAAEEPSSTSESREWASVEHFYQAQKFGGDGASSPDGRGLVEAIAAACSPEEAARIGRRAERQQPELMVEDWQTKKVAAMREGLFAKFTRHAEPRRLLLSTAGRQVVECCPHDYFWGCGTEDHGSNKLGQLLMELRDWLLGDGPPPEGLDCSGLDAAKFRFNDQQP